jgi:hypothetical protein
MDSASTAASFTIFKYKGDASQSAMSLTLNQIALLKYQVIAWNDEWPTGQTSSSKAHSKGVVAFDDKY